MTTIAPGMTIHDERLGSCRILRVEIPSPAVYVVDQQTGRQIGRAVWLTVRDPDRRRRRVRAEVPIDAEIREGSA